MATLYNYKCNRCGFSILSSEDGDNSLLSGPGCFYKCTGCNHVFTKNWIYEDYLSAKEYPLEKDNHLADILMINVPKEFQESLKNDVLWFQHEVVKGESSNYYGKTLTHDAVMWTEKTFWNKLSKFLLRKKYAKFINFKKFENATQRHQLRIYLAYMNCNIAYMNSKNNVKCIRCNGNTELWNPSKGCPICGNNLEKQDNYMILTD